MIPRDSPPGAQNLAEVLSVSALNQAVNRLLERHFPLTWVAGEISNFTKAASGHWYFTLKDANAQVRAVMFRGRAQFADFTPREGDRVEVRALVSLYAARGDFQLGVEAIRRAGAGNLYEAFLQLKQRLSDEGLFDPAHKRPIPRFVRTIGIVTSPQAAALRDIVSTLSRRAPHVQLILYPTPVQGEGAGLRIAQAIASASARQECEVLLVCRGGGSIEDLWAFNDEVVARTIASCAMPVICGIGHETDFTIADFAADLRAATPTAAAELATLARSEWHQALAGLQQNLLRSVTRHIGNAGQRLDWLSRRLPRPTQVIAREQQRLAHLQNQTQHAMHFTQHQARAHWQTLRLRLQARRPDSAQQRRLIEHHAQGLTTNLRHALATRQQSLRALHEQLELLNPQRTLERGYAIVSDATGQIVRGPQDLALHTPLHMRLAQGCAEIRLSSVTPEPSTTN